MKTVVAKYSYKVSLTYCKNLGGYSGFYIADLEKPLRNSCILIYTLPACVGNPRFSGCISFEMVEFKHHIRENDMHFLLRNNGVIKTCRSLHFHIRQWMRKEKKICSAYLLRKCAHTTGFPDYLWISPFLTFGCNWLRQTRQNGFQLLED